MAFIEPKRVEILGVPVDCLTMEAALERVDNLVTGNKPAAIIAVNSEKVIRAKKDPKLLKQLTNAGLLIPDGIGIVWAARILGLGYMERVPGSDLMPRICERTVQKDHKLFLFGGSPAVNEQAVAVLRARYPGIQIVGNQHGYINKEDIPNLIKNINHSGAEILFVALGSPSQEQWIASHLSKLNVKICQGVGGTFDVISGYVARAPAIIRKTNLEWLYRVIVQPRKLPRAILNIKFAYLVITEKARRMTRQVI